MAARLTNMVKVKGNRQAPDVKKVKFRDLLKEIGSTLKSLGAVHRPSSAMDEASECEEEGVEMMEIDDSTKGTLLTLSRSFRNIEQSILTPILKSDEITAEKYERASDAILHIQHNATLAQQLLGSLHLPVVGEDEAEDDESAYSAGSSSDDEAFYFRSRNEGKSATVVSKIAGPTITHASSSSCGESGARKRDRRQVIDPNFVDCSRFQMRSDGKKGGFTKKQRAKDTGQEEPPKSKQLHSWQEVTKGNWSYIIKELQESAMMLRYALNSTSKKGLLNILNPAIVVPKSGLSQSQTNSFVQKVVVVLQFLETYISMGPRNCYAAASTVGEVHALHYRTIAQWGLDFVKHGYFSVIVISPSAKFAMCYDEDFRAAARDYIRNENKAKKGMSAPKFRLWVNRTYSMHISRRTSTRWLSALGFLYKSLTKSIYFDGHEREDVVTYRVDFVGKMLVLKRTSRTYRYVRNAATKELELVENEPQLLEGEVETVIYWQDETICYAYDGLRKTWSAVDGTDAVAATKSNGRALMISDFVNDAYGFLRDALGVRLTQFLEIGKGNEGYWTAEDFAKHIERMLQAHDLKFGKGKKVAVFVFDHSSGHGASSSDELNTATMTLKPGSNSKSAVPMRDTTFLGKPQSFTLKAGDELLLHANYTFKKKIDDDTPPVSQTYVDKHVIQEGDNLCGQCKGAVMILKERQVIAKDAPVGEGEVFPNQQAKIEALSKLEFTKGKCKKTKEDPAPDCKCAKCVLSRSDDFANQGNLVDDVIADYNALHGTKHRAIILPKYHCELNPIERCWGRLKWYLREHCDYDFEHLKEAVKKGLDEENLPLDLIRRYALKSWAYIDAYSQNLDIIHAHNFVKEQKKHRSLIMAIEKVIEEEALGILTGENRDEDDDGDDADDEGDEAQRQPVTVPMDPRPRKPRLGSAEHWKKLREKEAARDDNDADTEDSKDSNDEGQVREVSGDEVPGRVRTMVGKRFKFEGKEWEIRGFKVVRPTRSKKVYFCSCRDFADVGSTELVDYPLTQVKKLRVVWKEERRNRLNMHR